MHNNTLRFSAWKVNSNCRPKYCICTYNVLLCCIIMLFLIKLFFTTIPFYLLFSINMHNLIMLTLKYTSNFSLSHLFQFLTRSQRQHLRVCIPSSSQTGLSKRLVHRQTALVSILDIRVRLLPAEHKFPNCKLPAFFAPRFFQHMVFGYISISSSLKVAVLSTQRLTSDGY